MGNGHFSTNFEQNVHMSTIIFKRKNKEFLTAWDILGGKQFMPLPPKSVLEYVKIANKGIKISRRTIAKYRDELNIPSSSRRKEFKID